MQQNMLHYNNYKKQQITDKFYGGHITPRSSVPRDKINQGGTLYPRGKVSPGTRYWGGGEGGQDKLLHRHGSLVIWASAWYTDGRWFDPHVQQTFFCGNLVMENFYSHSLPSADSRRAVVRKNVH